MDTVQIRDLSTWTIRTPPGQQPNAILILDLSVILCELDTVLGGVVGEAAKAIPLAINTPTDDRVRTTIHAEQSRDLVFAVVSYAGSGATWVADALSEELTAIGFLPKIIKVRKLLAAAHNWLSDPPQQPKYEESTLEGHQYLQNLGDSLRQMHGPSIAAGLAVREIYLERERAPTDKPLAFIVDSLKHPEEVTALRSIYGNAFYLLSIVCLPEKRHQRLRKKFKGSDPVQIGEFSRRDEAGKDPAGQHVRRTLHLGDFFVINEAEERGPLAESLSRFIQLITNTAVIRPTRDERGMNAAWGAAMRSSCLSRQVGAALLNCEGEVIATGTNDVPRFGGGLYGSGGSADHRCFKDGEYCRNDKTKREIYDEIFQQLTAANLVIKSTNFTAVQKCIEQTRVGDLIEFSRSVHAEMDALVSLARFGSPGAAGGTLYSTTYPCHSCARHIVAAGIREVVYIEPYPKSMAAQLHGDSILETTADTGPSSDRVHFRLFSGVAPRRFTLFEKHNPLKDETGALHLSDTPYVSRPLVFKKSYLDFERAIKEQIDGLEGAASTAA